MVDLHYCIYGPYCDDLVSEKAMDQCSHTHAIAGRAYSVCKWVDCVV
jgi:hypothetical protein